MLGTLSDAGIELKEMHRFPNIMVKVRDTFHWDVLRLWHEIQEGITRARKEAGEISGIGVDTWGVDFGLLNEAGELIGNPVCYRDARTNGMIEEVYKRIDQSRAYGITGIQTMYFNTLFQLASLSLRNAPALKAARKLLFTPDLLCYWLSGKMANEYTIASTGQLLDARKRQYSTDMLSAIGISPDLFAPLITPGQTLGTGIGVAEGIPVIAVGSHDTASAVAGVPAQGHDWLYLSSGTWSLLGAELDEPALSDVAAKFDVTNEGGVGGKIRLLKNIAGMWLLQECRRQWIREGTTYDYGTLAKLAESAPSQTAIIDPNDPVFASPGDMPGKIAAFCERTGQRAPRDVGGTCRVIIESLAVMYAKVAGILSDISGQKYTRLHIVGGGSQNNLLNQITADASGLTVLAGPIEATALGNIAVQAIGTGQLQDLAEARALIARTAQLRAFTPQDSARWAKYLD
jgi:rhamnulokinase